MKLEELIELYDLIVRSSEHTYSRRQARLLRKTALQPVSSGFTKVAFDTRRIDQQTEYNPRRGLQYYHRSQQFVSRAMEQKIVNFAKLRKVLVGLQEVYGKDPEWQDSNARILLSTLDKGLRTTVNDGDFTDSQPGVGSLDYIEELMHVRYRLGFDELTSMAEPDLRRVILSKDEELTHRKMKQALEITKSDVSKYGYDTLMEKLFSVSAPSEDQPVVERSITITIRDSFPNKLPAKKGS